MNCPPPKSAESQKKNGREERQPGEEEEEEGDGDEPVDDALGVVVADDLPVREDEVLVALHDCASFPVFPSGSSGTSSGPYRM